MQLEDSIRQRLSEEASDMANPDEILSRFSLEQRTSHSGSHHDAHWLRGWISVAAIAAAVLAMAIGGLSLQQDRAVDPSNNVNSPSALPHDQAYRQQILDDIVAEALKTRDTSGYGGSRINIDAMAVAIKWTDPVPADVQRLAGRDPASGAQVSVIVVPYSEADIEVAGHHVFTSVDEEGLVHPHVIGATNDSSGLRIEVKPSDLERAQLEITAFADLAGMPVQIVAGAAEPPQPN